MRHENDAHVVGEPFVAEVTNDGFRVPLLGSGAMPQWREELSARIDPKFSAIGVAGLNAIHSAVSELTESDPDQSQPLFVGEEVNQGLIPFRLGPRNSDLSTLFNKGRTLISVAKTVTTLQERFGGDEKELVWEVPVGKQTIDIYPIDTIQMRYPEAIGGHQQIQFGALLSQVPSKAIYTSAVIESSFSQGWVRTQVHTGQIFNGLLVAPSYAVPVNYEFNQLARFATVLQREVKK